MALGIDHLLARTRQPLPRVHTRAVCSEVVWRWIAEAESHSWQLLIGCVALPPSTIQVSITVFFIVVSRTSPPLFRATD